VNDATFDSVVPLKSTEMVTGVVPRVRDERDEARARAVVLVHERRVVLAADRVLVFTRGLTRVHARAARHVATVRARARLDDVVVAVDHVVEIARATARARASVALRARVAEAEPRVHALTVVGRAVGAPRPD